MVKWLCGLARRALSAIPELGGIGQPSTPERASAAFKRPEREIERWLAEQGLSPFGEF